LSWYYDILIEKGYDDINFWKEITEDTLINILKMKKGHADKFRFYVEKMKIENDILEESKKIVKLFSNQKNDHIQLNNKKNVCKECNNVKNFIDNNKTNNNDSIKIERTNVTVNANVRIGDYLCNQKNIVCFDNTIKWRGDKYPTGSCKFTNMIHPKYFTWFAMTDEISINSFNNALLNEENYIDFYNGNVVESEITNNFAMINNVMEKLKNKPPEKETDIYPLMNNINKFICNATKSNVDIERVAVTNVLGDVNDYHFDGFYWPDALCKIFGIKRMIIDYKPNRTLIAYPNMITSLCSKMNNKKNTLENVDISSDLMKGQYWQYCLFKLVSYAVWFGVDKCMETDGNIFILLDIAPCDNTYNYSKFNVTIYPVFGFNVVKFRNAIDLNENASYIFQLLKLYGNLFRLIKQQSNKFTKPLFQIA